MKTMMEQIAKVQGAFDAWEQNERKIAEQMTTGKRKYNMADLANVRGLVEGNICAFLMELYEMAGMCVMDSWLKKSIIELRSDFQSIKEQFYKFQVALYNIEK